MRVSNPGSRPLVPLLLGLLIARSVLPDVSFAAPADLPPEAAALVDGADAEGLPTGPLVAKAREGVAKRVEPVRIAAAIEELAGRMRRADEILGADEADRSPLLEAGAAAIREGVSPAALRQLDQLGQGKRVEAVLAVADLVALGLPEDQSVRLVQRAAASGAPTVAVRELGAAAASMLSHGASAEVVVAQLGTSSGGGGSGSEPPAHGAGGSKGGDPKGKGLDSAPGQQKK